MVEAMASPRCSRARAAAICSSVSRSRSIMVSRNTITVRAMTPISSDARVAGIRAEVSPAASRRIASARPLSGRVMLRPISQLNPSPIRTAAKPTQTMMLQVRDCEPESAVAAATALKRADAMMSSVTGISCRSSMSIDETSALTVSVLLIHSAKVSA